MMQMNDGVRIVHGVPVWDHWGWHRQTIRLMADELAGRRIERQIERWAPELVTGAEAYFGDIGPRPLNKSVLNDRRLGLFGYPELN